jgi:hypothetical protein
MAVDFSIRIDVDRSELGEDNVTTLEAELVAALGNAGTVTSAYNAAYVDDDATDQLLLDIGAGGTVTEDWGFRVLIDSTVSNNKKIEILVAICAVALKYTIDTITTAAAYAAGSTDTHQHEKTIT